jgi:hypothetical protein
VEATGGYAQGVIIVGHTRILAAKKLGLTEVPVVVASDLTPMQCKAYRLADNRTNEEAEWDESLLKLELEVLNLDGFDVALTALDLSEIEKLTFGEGAEIAESGDERSAEDENEPERPAETASAEEFPFTIYRPALNKTRSVRFLSVRRWRQSLKDSGIEQMRAIKGGCEFGIVDKVAAEFEDILSVLVGGLKHFGVTAPPSSKARLHFASEVARHFGKRTGASYVDVFKPRPRKSSSHPAHWNRRGDMKLTGESVPSRLLLLDDVATSGTTMEEAVQALRSVRPEIIIIPIVWIYGTC